MEQEYNKYSNNDQMSVLSLKSSPIPPAFAGSNSVIAHREKKTKRQGKGGKPLTIMAVFERKQKCVVLSTKFYFQGRGAMYFVFCRLYPTLN